MPLFKKVPKDFLGVDIGTSSIKVVELSRSRDKRELQNYGELNANILYDQPLISKSIKDSNLLSSQEIAEALKILLKESRIKSKSVNFSVPDFATFFTTIKLPILSRQELPQAMKYEARPYIPLPFSEVTLDWEVIEGTIGKTPLKILVAVIPNETIHQYQEIAVLAGLKLKALEAEVFALARAVSYEQENLKDRCFLLLDIGARTSTVNILDKGIVKLSHSFNIAGNELTDLLTKGLNIDYNKAEEMKIKHGLNSSQKSYNILLPLVDLIIEEGKKTARNFYQTEGKEIEAVILAGGVASLPGLKNYFTQQFKKGATIADPFAKLVSPPILKETLQEIGPSFAVAIGLALKGLE